MSTTEWTTQERRNGRRYGASMEMSPIQMSSVPARSSKWDVLLLAGDRPGGDPLAAQFAVASKSLVPVAGRPMLARVLATLVANGRIGNIYVLAQAPDLLFDHPDLAHYRDDCRIRPFQSGSSIAGSISATLRNLGLSWPVLVTTADNVMLDCEIIESFLDQSDDCDVAVGLVEERTAAADRLEGGRTWLRFNDVAVTGANLFALKSALVYAGLDYWQRIEGHRKKPWRMAWELGPAFLLSLVLRRLSLREAFDALGSSLGLHARPVYLPFARAGVDVDKLADHILVERLLAFGHNGHPGSSPSVAKVGHIALR